MLQEYNRFKNKLEEIYDNIAEGVNFFKARKSESGSGCY